MTFQNTPTDQVFLENVATQPGLTWQQRVKRVTDQYGIRASDAAKLLGPYYTSQKEFAKTALYSGQPSQVRGLTYQDQSYLQSIATAPNLTWQQRVQAVSDQYGIGAAQASQLLSPYYEAQTYQAPTTEAVYDPMFLRTVATEPGLTWQQRVKQVTDRYKISASRAAQLLNPYYLSESEQPTFISPPPGSPVRSQVRSPVSPGSSTLPRLSPVSPTLSPVRSPVSPVRSPVSPTMTLADQQFIRSVATAPDMSWQDRIRNITSQYGVSATQAAQMLDPYYVSQRERSAQASVSPTSIQVQPLPPIQPSVQPGQYLTQADQSSVDPLFLQQVAIEPGLTWPQRVKQVTQQYGIRASEAAKLLSPYYQRR